MDPSEERKQTLFIFSYVLQYEQKKDETTEQVLT